MCLHNWIGAYLCYDTTNNDMLKALNEESNKRLITYFHLINSDQNKHSNILINLNSKK